MSNQNPNVISRIHNREKKEDIVIIGAGLSGLTTAIILARAGRSVTVFEQSSKVGGRARTENVDSFYFNQGPHALYLSGEGAKVLQELGIKYRGSPPPSPQYFIKYDMKYQQGASFFSILTSKLLAGLGSKIELIRFFMSLRKMNFNEIQSITIEEWLKKRIHHRDVFDLLITLCRIVTYANEPEVQSAGSTLSQLQRAIFGGVLYLDGGWQTLVNELISEALKAHVKIYSGKRVSNVKEVVIDSPTSAEITMPLWRINVSDGSSILTSTLVIAGSPTDIQGLFRDSKPKLLSYIVGERANSSSRRINPVRAACLDVALNTLPDPSIPVAVGIDSPFFLSVHSASAKLAPKGGALIHVIKYLGSTHESNPSTDKLELEAFLDAIQPGWRNVVIRQRFLPSMIVYNAIVTAEQGGTLGRPDTKVPETENLYTVGDWIGSEGILADASFASAKRAAEQILKARPILVSYV